MLIAVCARVSLARCTTAGEIGEPEQKHTVRENRRVLDPELGPVGVAHNDRQALAGTRATLR